MIWLLRHPVHSSPVRNLDRGDTDIGRLRKRDNLLTGGGRENGRGAESQKTQEESLVLYESFNTTEYTE
jgi:hypothetical protein